MMILLVILALILPPLAVGIYEGITGRFWLVLILWLLGIGILAWLLPHLFYLGWILAVILALLIVLGVW
ncbi:MAG: YqaE/Pmp3 family membrane protein [Crocinitomicaceae bacterium]|nr:YqaE/Pmp3 family membrane protein [Crocinitomicaceae bacterium]